MMLAVSSIQPEYHPRCLHEPDCGGSRTPLAPVVARGGINHEQNDLVAVSFNFNGGGTMLIGSDGFVGQFNGKMDEIRISKGIARWTSGFTPPTGAYS
jgi:hypothetical protein